MDIFLRMVIVQLENYINAHTHMCVLMVCHYRINRSNKNVYLCPMIWYAVCQIRKLLLVLIVFYNHFNNVCEFRTRRTFTQNEEKKNDQTKRGEKKRTKQENLLRSREKEFSLRRKWEKNSREIKGEEETVCQ